MTYATDASYTGLQYAFLASGSFFAEQMLHDVSMAAIPQIGQYNVTTALQVMFDVRYFNSKIGLYKDASNINVSSNFAAFDPSSLKFDVDSITIPASDFIAGMQRKEQVMSVGDLSGIYSNFNQFVTDYFGNRFGFETLFDLSGQTNYNGGVFDASALIHIINSSNLDAQTKHIIRDLSGSITLSNINDSLNYIVYSNKFHNRSDPNHNGDYLLSTTPYWEPQLDASKNIIYHDGGSQDIVYHGPDKSSLKDLNGNPPPPNTPVYPLYYDGTLIKDGSGKQVYSDSNKTLYYQQVDGSLKDASQNYLPAGVQTFPAYQGLHLKLDASSNVVYHDYDFNQFYKNNADKKYYDINGTVLGLSVPIFPLFEPSPGRPVLDVSNNIIFQPVYDIAYGFVEDDLIFLQNGFQVTLSLDILNNSIDLNQLGFANVTYYEQKYNSNQQPTLTQGFKSVSTVADDKKIVTTINVPLLIKLKNLSSGPSVPTYPTTKSGVATYFI